METFVLWFFVGPIVLGLVAAVIAALVALVTAPFKRKR